MKGSLGNFISIHHKLIVILFMINCSSPVIFQFLDLGALWERARYYTLQRTHVGNLISPNYCWVPFAHTVLGFMALMKAWNFPFVLNLSKTSLADPGLLRTTPQFPLVSKKINCLILIIGKGCSSQWIVSNYSPCSSNLRRIASSHFIETILVLFLF